MSNSEPGRLFNWTFFIFFSIGLIFIIVTLTTEIPKLFQENEEKVVNDLYTVKGMYLGPTYYVILSDDSEHRISQKDFVQLEVGDTYQTFFSNVSQQDLIVYSIVTLIALCAFAIGTYTFAYYVFGEMKWFNKLIPVFKRLKATLSGNKRSRDRRKRMINLVFIAICLAAPLSVMKNTFHKLNPSGKTSIEAEIIDRKIYRDFRHRVMASRYIITYQYTDESGNVYKTQKDVTSQTYRNYKNKTFIPIAYRNDFPYDTFIAGQTFKEFIYFLFNVRNLLIVTATGLAVYFIYRYQVTWGFLPDCIHRKKQRES